MFTDEGVQEFVAKVHDAVGSGNVERMREVIAEQATVWENLDGKTRTFADVGRFHAILASKLDGLRFENVRLTPTSRGYIEQHDKILVRKSGEECRSSTCMVVEVEDGRIVKVEEYLDRDTLPPEVPEARTEADLTGSP